MSANKTEVCIDIIDFSWGVIRPVSFILERWFILFCNEFNWKTSDRGLDESERSKSKTAAAPAVAVTFNTASVYNASQRGVVNGITALKNLTIKGFDIVVVGASVGETINVSIYWRNGSVTDTGILTNSSVWTLTGSTNLSAVGYLQEIPITT